MQGGRGGDKLGNMRGKAGAGVRKAHGIELSERDSLRALELLENPPQPTVKAMGAARAPRRRSGAIVAPLPDARGSETDGGFSG
jgi:hypothetical protein